MDDLGLVEAVDRFGESVVVTVADASNGRLDACLRQPFGILDRYVLNTPVGVVDETTAMDWPPVMECLVQGIEDETRMSGSARPPADDAAGERVDHESDVNEALPSG